MFEFYTNLAVLICTAIAFGYGVIRFFRKGNPMYAQIIVCGIGCLMLGRLYQVVMLLTRGMIYEGFHVGVLGTIGSFVFFFSANFGQMDHLVDDGGTDKKKYRFLAFLAPAVIAAGCIPIALSDTRTENKIVCVIVMIFIMQASYFNLKHLLLSDKELDMLRSISNYNLLALIFALFSMAEMILWVNGNQRALFVVYPCICIVLLMLVPILEKGVKEWTI